LKYDIFDIIFINFDMIHVNGLYFVILIVVTSKKI